MSNTELEERESSKDDFSKIVDANYTKDEKKKLDDIAQKEETATTTPDDEGEQSDSIPFRQEKKRRIGGLGTKKGLGKKLLVGGGISGGIAALIVTFFISLLPLKIIHIFENLQRHFFATSESAVQNRSERLLSDYLKKKVNLAPSGPCSSTRTVDKDCVSVSDNNSQAGRLYNAWREARLENQLANRFGIEIARTSNTGLNQYRLIVDGNIANVDVDGWLNSTNDNKTLWTITGNRKDIRATLRRSFENQTYFKRVMYRVKVGRLLERKYGIRRCVFACNSRDKFDDYKDRRANAAQLLLIRRVVEPHTKYLGIALECVFTNSCGVNDTNDITPDGEDYQRRDVLEKKVAELLEKNAIEYSADSVAKIASIADEVLKYKGAGGFTNYLLQKMIDQFGSKYASKYAVPVIGWIDNVATIVNTLHNAGPKIKRWTFVMGATAMVSYYMLQASHASEIKAGHTQHDLVGSMVTSFGNTAGEPGRQNQPAENAPLYTALIGSKGQQRSILKTSFLPSALAADPANPDLAKNPYNCDNGQKLDTAKSLVCPEESLVSSNVLTTISATLDQPPWNVLTASAELWRDSVGRIFSAISKVISLGATAVDAAVSAVFPPYVSMKNAVGDRLNDLIKIIAQWFFPSPISANMSGARAFDMAAGGADVAGADFAHYGLGAKRVTDQVAARIQDEQENEALEDFQSRPLFARLFDKEEPQSFVSQLAMAMPTSTTNFTQSSLASLISNPFTKLFNGFAAMLPGHKQVRAAPINDPFGIPQYAYDLNDPEVQAAMGMNPESPALTDASCAQTNKDWAAGKGQFEGTLKIDKNTGMDVHTKVNPCLLNSAAATSAGAYFSTSVINSSDLGKN